MLKYNEYIQGAISVVHVATTQYVPVRRVKLDEVDCYVGLLGFALCWYNLNDIIY